MMDVLPIQALPNQSFTIRLGGYTWGIAIKTVRSGTVVDVSRDNDTIVSGAAAVAGFPILPYQYMEAGNFIFSTQNEEIPNWESFGVTQDLVYLTAAELEEYRSGGLVFSEYGALPDRYEEKSGQFGSVVLATELGDIIVDENGNEIGAI